MENSEDTRTIQALAQEALDVQNACNLSGVAHSFSRALTRLWQIAREEGWAATPAINQHPISVLYASKIADLTDTDAHFFKAYDRCVELAAGGVPVTQEN